MLVLWRVCGCEYSMVNKLYSKDILNIKMYEIYYLQHKPIDLVSQNCCIFFRIISVFHLMTSHLSLVVRNPVFGVAD